MNKEEKKAIERMIEVRDKNVHTFVDELTIILNLIEKLKLENNALQNTKDTCPFMATSGIRCANKKEEYIPKSVIREKIEEIQKLYEEELKKIDIKDFEDINFNNFKAIRLEVQRAILKELLGEEK